MQLLRKSEPAACNVRGDYRQTGNDMLMAPIPAVADNIVTCTERRGGDGGRGYVF